MEKSQHCLSFSSEKVRIIRDRGIVEKRTTKTEYDNHLFAIEFFKDIKKPILVNDMRVNIVPLIKYRNGCITTSYCEGFNLESLMRTLDKREQAKLIMKSFISFLRCTGFLWGDIAPRNLVVSHDKKNLWVLDLEKETKYIPNVSDEIWFRHLYKYAFEEVSCFYFQNETREILSLPKKIELPELNIKCNQIHSNRKKKLLASIYGYKEYYLLSHLLHIEELMASVAFPIFIDGAVASSMDTIEANIKKHGFDWYIDHVLNKKK